MIARLTIQPSVHRAGVFAAVVFAHPRWGRWVLWALDDASDPDLDAPQTFRAAADRFTEFHPCWELLRYWAPALWVASEVPT